MYRQRCFDSFGCFLRELGGGEVLGGGGGEDSRPVGIGLKSKNGVKNTENITELNYNFLGHTEIQVVLKTVKLSKSIY